MNAQFLKITAIAIGSTFASFGGVIAQDDTEYPRVVNPAPAISFDWNYKKSTLIIRAQKSCVSGGAEDLRDTFNADINYANKTVEIGGHFAYILNAPYYKKNCGPTLQTNMMIKNVIFGQYDLTLNGHKIKTILLENKAFKDKPKVSKVIPMSPHMNNFTNVIKGKGRILSGDEATALKDKMRRDFLARMPKNVPAGFNLNWSPNTNEAFIHIRTGCLPSSVKSVRDTFKVSFDEGNNIINITGNYSVVSSPNLLGSTDCMMSKTKIVKLSDIGSGQYDVRWYGKSLIKTELADEKVDIVGPFLSLSRPYVPYN